jgi:uncharacterized membrane protein YphA (DoxX/SURF4 family)
LDLHLKRDIMKRLTFVFLILLRLSIGWHFGVEGVAKVESPTWTSEPYLREASGPLAPFFRWLAGDSLLDRLTVQPLAEGQDPAQTPPHTRMPKALDHDWDAYAARFADYYRLDDAQRDLMATKLLQQKDKTVLWLLDAKKAVKRESPYGPPVDQELTTPQRIQEYQDKLAEAQRLQDQEMDAFGPDTAAKVTTAKGDANRMRRELRKDLDAQTAAMKQVLRDVLTVDQERNALESDVLTPEQLELAKKDRAYQQAKDSKELAASLTPLLAPEQADADPVPPPAKWPWPEPKKFDWPSLAWSRLQWIDWTTKYGLTLVGACLIAGLLTRTACVGGALFLLMFYLAMPPLPWLPENPKAEGHYLFINKNIIEMLALLALATTYSGRWLGLDGLLQFFNPRRWRRPAPTPVKK